MAKSLTICSDGHEEICYNETGECPVCKLIAELEGAEYEITELKDQIDDLKREVGNLTCR